MKRIYLILLSILSGLLFALSWPERGLNLLAFVAFVPLFFVQHYLGDTKKRGMFWLSWLAFLVWNTLTTWWIWYSTDVGAIMAIVLNSLFVAVIFNLFHISKKKLYQNKRGFIILLFFWLSWEYFHMNWDLTWSWLNLGNVFASSPKWIQWYEYTGSLGGTAWIVLVNVLVYHFIKFLLIDKVKEQAVLYGTLMILVIAIPIGVSYFIYANYQEKDNPVEVVVVQPNTDPYNEQYNLNPEILLEKNLEMAKQEITDNTRFVVFPESTLYDSRYSIWEENLWRSPLLQNLQDFIFDYPNISVVIGASTYRNIPEGETRTNAARKYRNADRYYYAYNTALLVDTSEILQVHHKSKLTPGVEIMPSWGILKPLESLAIDLGGTIGTLARDEKTVVFESADQTKISPIICYESVYGEFVSDIIQEGAELIFVITNDGWWGNTPGHRQHFLFSILRSIETRRSLARSANTGISSFINQRGDVFQRTNYWEPAVIKQQLNKNTELTYYVKNGDYLARISVFVSALILLIAYTQAFIRKRKNQA